MNPVPASPYDGVVERTADGGLVRFERHLPYAVADVWDAITNPSRLVEWWLPFPADITVDLREGGAMVFDIKGEQAMTVNCAILRLDPPTLLEHTHFEPDSSMRWELEAVDTGTVLRLTYFGPDADLMFEKCYVVGLHTSLSRLAPSIARTPKDWDWGEFAATQTAYAELGFAPPLAPA
jgi:uncharacterized protein YndB with AHSA1/START domain